MITINGREFKGLQALFLGLFLIVPVAGVMLFSFVLGIVIYLLSLVGVGNHD